MRPAAPGPFVFTGATAVVTGAASGIGEALAHALARRGSHLVLLDRDTTRLAAVATAITTTCPTTQVTTHHIDLADAAATRHLADTIAKTHPRIRLLVNNAGVALSGRFDQVSLDDFEWVVDINFLAVVRLTHTLLPCLRAEPGAHLVNVSSLFGLVAPAGQAAYAASKFAVRGFTEALRHELADEALTVTSVHPGGIRTRIAQSARTGSGVPHTDPTTGPGSIARRLTIDPTQAADEIIRGIQRRRARVLIGRSTTALDLLARVLPSSYGTVLAAATRTRQPTPH